MKKFDAGSDISGFGFGDALDCCSHEYLLPKINLLLKDFFCDGVAGEPKRVFDLGAGNGSMAHHLSEMGYSVVGVDPSLEGLAQAKEAFPELRIEEGSCYEDLAGRFGQFPVVISLEVVEHLYAPRQFAATVYQLVQDGGRAVISTPFHGYWKNLAIAVLGKFDRHVNPLWDHGHIKFWSERTLGGLLMEAGFRSVSFCRAGRFNAFAKSIIAIAEK